MNQPLPTLRTAPRTKRSRWFVVGVVAALVILIAGFVIALLFTIGSMFRNSEPYSEAMSRVERSADAAARLGTPIVEAGMPGGSLSVSDEEGDVALQIPVRGPEGEGVLVVVGYRERGHWRYTRIELQVREGKPIDLRSADERTGMWPL